MLTRPVLADEIALTMCLEAHREPGRTRIRRCFPTTGGALRAAGQRLQNLRA